MSKLSQFEREVQAQAERTKREQNIATIEANLAEARSIAEVVQTQAERTIVGREIDRLENMLAEEKQLYDTAGISKEDTDCIVAGMRF